MSKRMILATGFIAGLVFVGAGAALADLIMNGSFELGDFAPGEAVVTVPAGSTAITGWSVGGDGVDWHLGGVEGSGAHFGPAYDGDLVVDLNRNGDSSGTISQTFATEVGATYLLTFHFAASDWFTNPRLVQVDVADITSQFAQPGSPQYDLQYGEFSVEFTAIADQTTVTFSSPDPSGYWGPILDGVSVEPTVAAYEQSWSNVKSIFR